MAGASPAMDAPGTPAHDVFSQIQYQIQSSVNNSLAAVRGAQNQGRVNAQLDQANAVRPDQGQQFPTQPYVPPSAWETWKNQRDQEAAQAHQQTVMRQYSGDTLSALFPEFGMEKKARDAEAAKAGIETDGQKRKDMAAGIFDRRNKAFNFNQDLTPAEQTKFADTSRKTREDLSLKQDLVNKIDTVMAKDVTLPQEERQAATELARALKYDPAGGKYGETNPLVISLRNLGTRSEFRIMLNEWKTGKKGKTAGGQTPPGNLDLGATGDEIDAAGGLGGFIQQSNGKSSDYDSTPSHFGYLIRKGKDGVDQIIKTEDWITAKMTDLTPAPHDSQAELDRKAAQSADLISTLAFADKYSSFAKKRDAGYRIQLDSNGNPIRAYLHSDDKQALQNLLNDVMVMQEGGVISPVEDFMKAYADERRGIAEVATGVNGNGTSSGSGSGGHRSGGGGGGYGSGGAQVTDPALLKEAVDAAARSRMGRALTPEESAAFIDHFHSIEAAVYAGGGAYTKFDPQSQAMAWIEATAQKETAGQQGGKYIVALMNMLKSGNLTGSIGGGIN
jgi:hypothetical protein